MTDGSESSRRDAVIASPVGPLRLSAAGDFLVGIDFVAPAAECWMPDDALLRETAEQVARYFEDSNHVFSLPLKLVGTAYLSRVWDALRAIRVGRVETYGGLAARVGGSARAVGTACRRNPLPIIIPCHRVVAARGFGGYCGFTSGSGLAIKRWLLAHEGCRFG